MGNEEDPILLTLDALVPDEMGQESVDTECDKKGKSSNEVNGIHTRVLRDGFLLWYARILRCDQDDVDVTYFLSCKHFMSWLR